MEGLISNKEASLEFPNSAIDEIWCANELERPRVNDEKKSGSRTA